MPTQWFVKRVAQSEVHRAAGEDAKLLAAGALHLQLAREIEREQQLVGAPGGDPREAPALERVGDADVRHGLMVLRPLLDIKWLIFYTRIISNI